MKLRYLYGLLVKKNSKQVKKFQEANSREGKKIMIVTTERYKKVFGKQKTNKRREKKNLEEEKA
jgi:hypothetical protein